MNLETRTAKRRRVEATLSKPFRSPFKTPRKLPAREDGKARPSTSPPALAAKTPSLSLEEKQMRIGKPKPLRTPVTPRTSTHLRSVAGPRITTTLTQDPALEALRKQHRQLERELRELKVELDTVEQAHKIETKGQDEELIVLMEKWKGAARAAAEEMFGKVSDRVNRMGGPEAWKEMQKKKNDWGNGGWDDGVKKENDVEDGEEDENERGKYLEYDGDEPERANEEESDEEGFTMGMMLKSLNIDLDLIGYDKEAQRWAD